MGILDFLFGRNKEKVKGAAPRPAARNTCDDAELARDGFERGGDVVEIARILTNGNPDVVRDFSLLARDHKAFAAQYPDWCGEMLEDCSELDEIILNVVAYWLVGHDTEYKFGGYIDWKESTEEILAHLREAIANLGYPLNVDEIEFAGNEFTFEALQVIDAHFHRKGYTLLSLDIGGDCYHLFIVPLENWDRLVELGQGLGLHFFNGFEE